MRSKKTTNLLHVAMTLTAVAGIAVFAGCRGERSDRTPRQILPDMDDSPKWKPQSESEFFADHRTMRPRVAGTVAFGATAEADEADREKYLKDDSGLYHGRDGDSFVDFIPASITVDSDLLQLGRTKFEVYCSICHGYMGEGGNPPSELNPDGSGGMVGRRWSYPVPTFHDEKYQDRAQRTGKDGYLFDVIRYGKWDDQIAHTGAQKMPGYAHALEEHEVWAVVAYLRLLQASRVDAELVDPDKRPARTGSMSLAEEKRP